LTRTFGIDPRQPDREAVAAAADVIREGGVVVIPTRHLYGLAADALNPAALARVYAIKGRPADKPLLILVKSRSDLPALVKTVPEEARRLMDRFWPGRLTLVFVAREVLPSVLTGGTGKVGIRRPAHPVGRALLDRLSRPVTATSANLSEQAGCHRLDALAPALWSAVDLVLDAGPLPPGPGSSVVDVTVPPPRVLREGQLTTAQIEAVLAANA
jgi:L-threonylcarbamoyladenylate synthase